MIVDLSGIALPSIFKRENREYYFDPYRKCLIQVTTEETVRQRVPVYLEETLSALQAMLIVETPISRYFKGKKGRADIVIHRPLPNGDMEVMAVVECKQEGVALSDNITGQQYVGYVNAGDFTTPMSDYGEA